MQLNHLATPSVPSISSNENSSVSLDAGRTGYRTGLQWNRALWFFSPSMTVSWILSTATGSPVAMLTRDCRALTVSSTGLHVLGFVEVDEERSVNRELGPVVGAVWVQARDTSAVLNADVSR